MKLQRKTTHRLSHRLSRRLAFRLTCGSPGPNYAREAATAFGRFIKLHRRLMKLVPEVFDYGIEMHLRKQKQEDEAHMLSILPSLEKIYGSAPSPDTAPSNVDRRCRNSAGKVQHPLGHLSPVKRCKVEALYEERNLWLRVGGQALDNLKKHPHRLISFALIARMLDLGFTMKRLMCGLETNLKRDPHEHLYRRDWMEDLTRIYGSASGESPPKDAELS